MLNLTGISNIFEKNILARVLPAKSTILLGIAKMTKIFFYYLN